MTVPLNASKCLLGRQYSARFKPILCTNTRNILQYKTALDIRELAASQPGRFTPCERVSCTNWIEGCMNFRASLEAVKKKKLLLKPEIYHGVYCRAHVSLVTIQTELPLSSHNKKFVH
jgi:hypothetical protein